MQNSKSTLNRTINILGYPYTLAYFTVSFHLTSLIVSATLSEMMYNETNFTIGGLMYKQVLMASESYKEMILNEMKFFEDVLYCIISQSFLLTICYTLHFSAFVMQTCKMF